MSAFPPFPPIEESPTPNMSVTCPHCQARLLIHPSQAGTAANCPKCTGRFQVPLPTAVRAGATQYSASPLSPEAQAFVSQKMAAGICGIVLGFLGVHKFILGLNKSGAIMLAVSVLGSCLYFPLLAMMVIGIIEGITYLSKSDDEFYQTYAIQKKEWF